MESKAFWRIVDAAQTQSGETEVEFFGPISETSWLGDEITPKEFKDELYAKGKGQAVTLKVNSPGGEVFVAAAIRAILQDYPGRVTADIIGVAASAATVVVSGADHVRMRDTAMFMIHDPSTIAWGTIAEMERVVDLLKQVKETIINGYQAKTKKDREELSQMMSSETWMTAEDAKEAGFVDEIVKDSQKTPKLPKNVRAAFLNCIAGYQNMPEMVLPEFEEETTTEDAKEEKIVVEEEVIPAEQADNATELEAALLLARVKAIIGKEF